MREPLKYELHGSGEPNYVRIYECEHITDRTYPVQELGGGVLHVGQHASIAVCKHCWQHVRGMVAEEVIRESLRHKSIEEIREMIAAPREKV